MKNHMRLLIKTITVSISLQAPFVSNVFKRTPTYTVTCPLCWQEFGVPEESIKQILENYFINKLEEE